MNRMLKSSIAIVVGFSLYLFTLQRPYALAMISKAAGQNEPCPWRNLISYPWSTQRMNELERAVLGKLKTIEQDPNLRIELIQTPVRTFWIKQAGGSQDGKTLLAFLLAEQEWITGEQPLYGVRPGDVVVDVGAHIGTFGDDALRRGASKVVMVEPDPVNVECIRRNFRDEITSGRVVVVPEGAWSKTDTMEFSLGVANSGTGSLVVDEIGSKKIKIPVRRLDEILKSVNVSKIDFIKMDIEGAEREALRGATMTLKRDKPRIMLDSYHLRDDDIVLPRLLHEINPDYQAICSVCSNSRFEDDKRIVPYAVFYK